MRLIKKLICIAMVVVGILSISVIAQAKGAAESNPIVSIDYTTVPGSTTFNQAGFGTYSIPGTWKKVKNITDGQVFKCDEDGGIVTLTIITNNGMSYYNGEKGKTKPWSYNNWHYHLVNSAYFGVINPNFRNRRMNEPLFERDYLVLHAMYKSIGPDMDQSLPEYPISNDVNEVLYWQLSGRYSDLCIRFEVSDPSLRTALIPVIDGFITSYSGIGQDERHQWHYAGTYQYYDEQHNFIYEREKVANLMEIKRGRSIGWLMTTPPEALFAQVGL